MTRTSSIGRSTFARPARTVGRSAFAFLFLASSFYLLTSAGSAHADPSFSLKADRTGSVLLPDPNGPPYANFPTGLLMVNGVPVVGGGGGGGGGSVSSVGLFSNAPWLTVGASPVTTSGTLTLNLTGGLMANKVLATPDGATGAVNLRSLVANDIPALPESKITSLAADLASADRLTTGTVLGTLIQRQMSITADGSGLKLSGDTASPGANKVYGTDGSGIKGWQTAGTGSGSISSITGDNGSNVGLTLAISNSGGPTVGLQLGGTLNWTSINRTGALPQDIGAQGASLQLNGSGSATVTWTSGKYFLKQNAALTQSVTGTLPPTSAYADGQEIVYSDRLTSSTAPYGVGWSPDTGDTVNGSNGPLTAFIGGGTVRFRKNGTDWEQTDTHFSIATVQDFTDPSKQMTFDLSAVPTSSTLTVHALNGAISDLLGTSTVRGIAKDIYIAVRTDGRTGTGTAEDPFNAGGSDDNAKATAFDGLMNNYQSTSNVVFHLSAGDYRTDIENRTWVPQPGWRMEGAGMYGTTIKGVTSASSLGAFDHEVIKATLSVATDSFVLRNLTLDANGAAISALAPTANSERNCSVYGLSIAGSNILIENVRVIHQYGSAANLQEAFGLSVRGPSTSNGKNDEIRNCGAELPTGNYGAPFSMAGFTGHPLADSRVVGSWGYGLSGTGATIGFSSGGVNAAYFTNLTVRGNTFIDCASIFYQDTGTTDGLIVDGNILIGGYRGIALEATTLTGGTTKQNISITKNTIGIKNRVNGSIEGIFIGNADTTNVNISGDNLVTYDSSGAGTSTPWGIQASNVVSGICRQNCFADVNNKFLGTGVLRSKNRGPDGAILADANIGDNDIPTYIGSLTSGYGVRVASDKIEFLYNGTQAVRFDSSGDVVAKTGGAYEWDQQGALFTAADGQFYFTNWAGSPTTVRLGLGTNSPTSALQIGPASNTATKYQQLFGAYNGTTGYPNLLINNSGSEFLGIGALGPDLAIGSSASPAGNGWDVQFARVFQTDGGMLLGTGTSSPGAKVFQAEGGYKSGDGTTGATGTDGFNSFKNGLATTIGTISGGDKLGLTPTAVKTANYSAAAGDLVPCDTTSAGFTVTLPTAPADKSVVAIKHVIQGGTNTVTLATGGSDVFNKASGGTSGTLTLVNQGILLQYKSSSAIWYAVADDIPLSGMDARFATAAQGALAASAVQPSTAPTLTATNFTGTASLNINGTVGATTANTGEFTNLTLSGNQSAAAWTTSGLRLKGIAGTLTDTTSSGTVAAAYTNKLGGNTIAASSATTFTDYISGYFSEPVAGTNVTLTNKWALGADSLYVGTSNPFKVTSAGAVSAVSPAFSGTPTAPTATAGTNTTQIATTAFVKAAVPTSSYRTLLQSNCRATSGQGAGTYFLDSGQTTVVASGSNSAGVADIINIVGADYPTVNGAATTMRLRAEIATNSNAPAMTFTLGLYPVTVGGSSANNVTYTLGTVVSGSTVTFTTPAASTITTGASTDFAIPADGAYVTGVVLSTNPAANTGNFLTVHLQTRN